MDATFCTELSLHTSGHKPECNDSPFLEPREASSLGALVGLANWLVTLGRFDVAFAMMRLAHFAATPCKGHMKEIKHIFGHVKHCLGRKIIVHGSMLDHLNCQMEKFDWTKFCPDIRPEELPPGMLEARGKLIKITTCCKDSDLVADAATHHLATGVLPFCNNMPIKWILKQQKMVEMSTHGA